jgi:hypothetical protein
MRTDAAHEEVTPARSGEIPKGVFLDGKSFRNGKRVAAATHSGRRKKESKATWQQD